MGRRLGWLLLLAATTASADQWTFFYPELVESYSCQVNVVDLQEHGSGVYQEKWEAAARAKRGGEAGDWQFTIGLFPLTKKGRHDAEKACSKWMDEAEKRVRKARG